MLPMLEPPGHERGRGEVDRQPLGRRCDHDVAIPGIAVAPGIAREVERRAALRRQGPGLIEIRLALRQPRLEPILRSEDRRVGKAWVMPCRSRVSAYH